MIDCWFTITFIICVILKNCNIFTKLAKSDLLGPEMNKNRKMLHLSISLNKKVIFCCSLLYYFDTYDSILKCYKKMKKKKMFSIYNIDSVCVCFCAFVPLCFCRANLIELYSIKYYCNSNHILVKTSNKFIL